MDWNSGTQRRPGVGGGTLRTTNTKEQLYARKPTENLEQKSKEKKDKQRKGKRQQGSKQITDHTCL